MAVEFGKTRAPHRPKQLPLRQERRLICASSSRKSLNTGATGILHAPILYRAGANSISSRQRSKMKIEGFQRGKFASETCLGLFDFFLWQPVAGLPGTSEIAL